jgi:hypothetical protein
MPMPISGGKGRVPALWLFSATEVGSQPFEPGCRDEFKIEVFVEHHQRGAGEPAFDPVREDLAMFLEDT